MTAAFAVHAAHVVAFQHPVLLSLKRFMRACRHTAWLLAAPAHKKKCGHLTQGEHTVIGRRRPVEIAAIDRAFLALVAFVKVYK